MAERVIVMRIKSIFKTQEGFKMISRKGLTLISLLAFILTLMISYVRLVGIATAEDTKNDRFQTCVNHSEGGFFRVDTTNGKIWQLKDEKEEGKYIGQPESAREWKPDTYIPYENRSGAGLFILNSTTGEAWWTNGKDWKKPVAGKPDSEKDNVRTYIPYGNKSGAGFFILNTKTGEVWWTNGSDSTNPGKPDAEAGEIGTYMPEENEKGAGFLISNTKTGVAWWTNGKDWSKLGNRKLIDNAQKLFDEKKFEEALKLYQEIYENTTDLITGKHSLMMIGLCYDWLNQNEKAIEHFKKSIQDYPDLKDYSPATFFYLGSTYAKTKQTKEALEAFKECVRICEDKDWKPEKFPWKNAREWIEKLEGKSPRFELQISSPKAGEKYGAMVLDGQAISSMDELLGKFKEATKEQKGELTIISDKGIPYSQILEVMKYAIQANIDKIQLVMTNK